MKFEEHYPLKKPTKIFRSKLMEPRDGHVGLQMEKECAKQGMRREEFPVFVVIFFSN